MIGLDLHVHVQYNALVRLCEMQECSKLQEYVLRFLASLGEQFSQVKMKIEQMDPFPLMNYVFSMILQQESKMNGKFHDESKILVNAAAKKQILWKKKGA